MVFRAKRGAPKSDFAFLAPSGEEDGVVLGEDGYTVLFKENFATMVAELSNSEKIVFEVGHDLSVVNW